MTRLTDSIEAIAAQEKSLREGGSEAGRKRQAQLGRLTVRQRLEQLLDKGSEFFETGLWAAWQMYSDYGEVPAAGVVTGIGRVNRQPVMIVANDATVKAGAFFPQTVKKVLRAQRIGAAFRLPIIYLVDSAGVFLPLQDEIFPDEDDFGRIFRNNAVISALGIPQYAAVMGNCVAGGAYLPVLCDKVLMTEGSQMCLAGASLVKAAIGQVVDPEELGGAAMHSKISGTVDFHEPDDRSCLQRLRSLVGLLERRVEPGASSTVATPELDPSGICDIVAGDGSEYDIREVLRSIVDSGSIEEYKAEFGPTLVTAFARIAGRPVGIVANQRTRSRTAAQELQIGGVLYVESVEKAARFVLDCNQTKLPLLFFQDVQGFMVGKQAEQAGIIRAGAKLVNAVSNSVVPKFTVIVGGSFGAGNYALCGKAYDPWLILAWPNACYAVMGSAQAAETLLDLKVRDAHRHGQTVSEQQKEQLRAEVRERYDEQMDIRYGAARGWVDAIIAPEKTRLWLTEALQLISDPTDSAGFRLGVFQV